MRKITIFCVLSVTLLSQVSFGEALLKSSLCKGSKKLADLPLFGKTTQFTDDSGALKMAFEKIGKGVFKKGSTRAMTCQIGTYNVIEILIPERMGFLLVTFDYIEPTGAVFLNTVSNFDGLKLTEHGISYKMKKDTYGEYLRVDPKTARNPVDLIESISQSSGGRYRIVAR